MKWWTRGCGGSLVRLGGKPPGSGRHREPGYRTGGLPGSSRPGCRRGRGDARGAVERQSKVVLIVCVEVAHPTRVPTVGSDGG